MTNPPLPPPPAPLLLGPLLFPPAGPASTRGSLDTPPLSHMTMSASGDDGGDGCATKKPQDEWLDGNRCLAHCTADFQIAASAMALVKAPGDGAIRVLPRVDSRQRHAGLDGPPAGTPSSRI